MGHHPCGLLMTLVVAGFTLSDPMRLRSLRSALLSCMPSCLPLVLVILLLHWPSSVSTEACVRIIETNGYLAEEYPANKPIEDRHAVVEAGGELHAVVLDGHGGTTVSEYLKDNLIPNILAELHKLDSAQDDDDVKVADAITAAFLSVENNWIASLKTKTVPEQRKLAMVGACALYALVRHSKVYLANAGDCRAVVARKSVGGRIYPVSISFDHNVRETREREVLTQAHPGEADIVVCPHPGACYVKGVLQPTRSFGDLHLKLPEYCFHKSWTLPYISAVPEVTLTRLDHRDLFLILASDGLWDVFSNIQAISIVAKVLNNGGSIKDARNKLINAALEKVAAKQRKPVESIKSLPQGSKRRAVHDDITVVVVGFKEVRKGYCTDETVTEGGEGEPGGEEEEDEYYDLYEEEDDEDDFQDLEDGEGDSEGTESLEEHDEL